MQNNLKSQFPELLSGPELLLKQAEDPPGLTTGHHALDSRLPWQGIPRGALSLLVAPPGRGATTLWLDTARELEHKKRWSLWISDQMTLFAPALWRKGIDLRHLYIARAPTRAPTPTSTPSPHPHSTRSHNNNRDFQFLLRESLESKVFTLVGCEVQSLRSIKRMLPKLKTLAEKTQTSFMFLSQDPTDLKRTHEMSWVAEFQPDSLVVHKVKNRPSFTLPWRGPYANLLSQLSPTSSPLGRRGFSEVHASLALSGAESSFRRDPTDPLAVQKFEKPA